MKEAIEVDIFIIGDLNVANTTLLRRIFGSIPKEDFIRPDSISQEEFNPKEFIPTTSNNPRIKKVVDGVALDIGLLDIPANYSDNELWRLSYLGTNVLLLVFDVTNRESFDSIKTKWLKKTSECEYLMNVPFVLVGTKTDKEGQRVVTLSEGKSLAENLGGAGYFECLESTKDCVQNALEALMKAFIAKDVIMPAIKESRYGYTAQHDKKKVFLTGNANTGKTAFLKSCSGIPSLKAHFPTECEQGMVESKFGEKFYSFELWSVGGNDSDYYRPEAYPGTDLLVLVFDVTNRDSFNSIRTKWFPEFIQHFPLMDVPFILVGTKTDKEEQREVTLSEGKLLAKSLGAVTYLECSAYNKNGIKEILDQVVMTTIDSPVKAPTTKMDQKDIDVLKRLVSLSVHSLAKNPDQAEGILDRICVSIRLNDDEINQIITDTFAEKPLSHEENKELFHDLNDINIYCNTPCKKLGIQNENLELQNKDDPLTIAQQLRKVISSYTKLGFQREILEIPNENKYNQLTIAQQFGWVICNELLDGIAKLKKDAARQQSVEESRSQTAGEAAGRPENWVEKATEGTEKGKGKGKAH